MRARLFQFLLHPTSRNVIVNSSGNIINIFFVALFAVVLVRLFSPADYGVLSVLMSVSYVMANILEFGTSATIYSYLPPLISEKKEERYRFLKSMGVFQTILAGSIVAILLVIIPYIDIHFLKTNSTFVNLAVAVISIMFYVWQNFMMNILLAGQRFTSANIFLNIGNLTKGLGILYLWITHSVSVTSILILFGIVSPAMYLLLASLKNRSSLASVTRATIHKQYFQFRYTITYFAASQLFNLAIRSDLFMVSYLKTNTDAGFYALGQKAILTILSLVISITQVLSPMYSKATTQIDMKKLLKKSYVYMLAPISILAVFIILPTPMYDLVFTTEYRPAIIITRVMAVAYIILTLSHIPSLFLLYTVKKPQIHVMVNALLLVGVVLGYYFSIPRWGIVAPAVVLACGFLGNTVIQTLLMGRYYRKLKE